jgi:hypothetical protein
MAFKLIEAAEDRRCYVNGAALVALVRARVTFRKGVLVETVAKQEELAASSVGRADPQRLTRRGQLNREGARHEKAVSQSGDGETARPCERAERKADGRVG